MDQGLPSLMFCATQNFMARSGGKTKGLGCLQAGLISEVPLGAPGSLPALQLPACPGPACPVPRSSVQSCDQAQACRGSPAHPNCPVVACQSLSWSQVSAHHPPASGVDAPARLPRPFSTKWLPSIFQNTAHCRFPRKPSLATPLLPPELRASTQRASLQLTRQGLPMCHTLPASQHAITPLLFACSILR